MNFEDVKEALLKGEDEIEFHGFVDLNDQEQEKFYRLLSMNAKTITSVELCQEGRNWSCSDDARRRLEKIFTGSKNLYKINPSTNRLRSQGVMNWAEADRWRKVLTDGSNTRRDLTKIECEEIRDRLPLIRTQYFLSEKELLLDGEAVGDDVVFYVSTKILPYAAAIAKAHCVYLLEFLDDDWRLGLPEEKELAEWYEDFLEEERRAEAKKLKIAVSEEVVTPNITPQQIRERFLKSRGVRLGFVEGNNGVGR